MESSVNISCNVNRVRDKILSASLRAGRSVDEVTLVAVSKYISIEKIKDAIGAGQFVFGESYVQEICKKIEACNSNDVRFDLIGHLQRNKVKHVVGLCTLIHSVDSKEIASAVNLVANKLSIKQDVLIQVNISGETSKYGASPDVARQLCYDMLSFPNLSLLGLMCIGQSDVSEAIRQKEFSRMRELRDRISSELCICLPELSMGMSDDFEGAIEEGATIVRVGSAIFGERVRV